MPLVAGVDEVGRGPWFGPVVAAAVILPDEYVIDGLTDSKKLSPKKRSAIADAIKSQAIAYSIAEASSHEIDQINILRATHLAMQRSVRGLGITPDDILVDGNSLPKFNQPARAIIKGDLTEPAISAASIIAKVYRDELITTLAELYPNYGLENHKGYGTKAHREAIETYGVTPLHRKSFKPIRDLIEMTPAG